MNVNNIFNDEAYVRGVAQEARVSELSEDQLSAIECVRAFLDCNDRHHMVIGGVAGSGKSTIIPHLVKLRGNMYCLENRTGEVAVCAYTGKAVMNLKRKGMVDAMTLHSFLFDTKYVKDEHTGDTKVVHKPRGMAFYRNIKLLIVDEASMLSRDMYDMIESLPFKALYIGDHFQLPPVNDSFNIMLKPDFRLDRIHRQNEGNPIVMLADLARQGKPLPLGTFGSSKHTRSLNVSDLVLYDEVITWTNATKDAVNDIIRRGRGYPMDIPQLEDKMIVRVNNRSKNVYNGQIVYLTAPPMRSGVGWNVEFVDELAYDDPFVMALTDSYTKALASVHLPKDELERIRLMPQACKGRKDYAALKRKNPYQVHLDWGYAITCHAAQGTSWKNVAVILEDKMKHVMNSDEWNRWVYTAITRAEESVTIYSISKI